MIETEQSIGMPEAVEMQVVLGGGLSMLYEASGEALATS